jgi:hypothetical protein
MLIRGPLGTIPPPQTCKPLNVLFTVLCITANVVPSVELVLLPLGKDAIKMFLMSMLVVAETTIPPPAT